MSFYVYEKGTRGELHSAFFRNTFYSWLETLERWNFEKKSGSFPPVKNSNILIVEIDEASQNQVGPWPWHRDSVAELVERIFTHGAKALGLNLVFPNEDRRVPENLARVLRNNGLGQYLGQLETDPSFVRTLQRHHEKIVMGLQVPAFCQPVFEDCKISSELNTNLKKYKMNTSGTFETASTPAFVATKWIINNSIFETVSSLGGVYYSTSESKFFPLVVAGGGDFYPSLPLAMAELLLKDRVRMTIDSRGAILEMMWTNSGGPVSEDPLGRVAFPSKLGEFSTISASDLLSTRALASEKESLFKDTTVLLGTDATALKKQASILQGLLSKDRLGIPTSSKNFWITFWMLTGGLAFILLTHFTRLPISLGVAAAFLVAFYIYDFYVLVPENIYAPTSFVYFEGFLLFASMLFFKNIFLRVEQRKIQASLGRTLAAPVLKEIIKNPDGIRLEGERKIVTALYGEFNSFHQLSAKMDSKYLTKFLNSVYRDLSNIIIYQFHGTMDRNSGNSILAYWGAPVHQSQHALKASQAAIKIVQTLAQRRGYYKREFGIDVEIGIGIGTGVASLGHIGTRANAVYTIMGEPVDLAKRLVKLTRLYRAPILTTSLTAGLLSPESQVEVPRRTLDAVKLPRFTETFEISQIMDHEVSLKSLGIFKQARELFLARDFETSLQKFEAADELLRRDADQPDFPSKIYIHRCEHLRRSAPEKIWDGSWDIAA